MKINEWVLFAIHKIGDAPFRVRDLSKIITEEKILYYYHYKNKLNREIKANINVLLSENLLIVHQDHKFLGCQYFLSTNKFSNSMFYMTSLNNKNITEQLIPNKYCFSMLNIHKTQHCQLVNSQTEQKELIFKYL